MQDTDDLFLTQAIKLWENKCWFACGELRLNWLLTNINQAETEGNFGHVNATKQCLTDGAAQKMWNWNMNSCEKGKIKNVTSMLKQSVLPADLPTSVSSLLQACGLHVYFVCVFLEDESLMNIYKEKKYACVK